MKRPIAWLLVMAIVAAAFWVTTPARVSHQPQVPAAVDLLTAAAESTTGLVPGTEKRLSWFQASEDSAQQKTEWAVVALHGFSATRQETAPLAEDLAAALGANLFEARLTGHGELLGGMTDVRAEDWLDDAATALAIGAQIGDKVIVIAVSTGATLAASLIDHDVMKAVDTLVFISPNYFPYDENAAWMTRPFGKLLTRLIVGETRSWDPYNESQGIYWTTSYPSSTMIEAMRLVDYANAKLPVSIDQRLQVFYSPDDEVISTAALRHAFANTESPGKVLVEVNTAGDPSNHVLAGDILSPDRTNWMQTEILRFVLPSDAANVED